MTHCGPKRAASREAVCTPATTPSEFTANSRPYCWASSPWVAWKRNGDAERYENNPEKVMPPITSTPRKTRSESTER